MQGEIAFAVQNQRIQVDKTKNFYDIDIYNFKLVNINKKTQLNFQLEGNKDWLVKQVLYLARYQYMINKK